MHSRSLLQLASTAVTLLAIATFAPAAHADTRLKSCGKTEAGTVSLRVAIWTVWETRRSPYSCATARGVLRAYARSKPTQRKPTADIRYRGKTWSCTFPRDGREYHCAPKGDYRSPYAAGVISKR
jgi:hypothetical protein